MAATQQIQIDRWQALGVSSIIGSLVGAAGLTLSALFSIYPPSFAAMIPVFVLSAMFSFPVWCLGIGLMGLPVHAVFHRFGLGGRIVSTLIGAIMVGAVWTIADGPLDEVLGSLEWWAKAATSLTGILSGGLAGYFGWAAAQPRTAP